jgi:hypothetical protein
MMLVLIKKEFMIRRSLPEKTKTISNYLSKYFTRFVWQIIGVFHITVCGILVKPGLNFLPFLQKSTFLGLPDRSLIDFAG